jgi:hypothetical protein
MNMRRLFIALTLLLLCCSGCSRIALGYNYADWLLRYWISDYTSFKASQKEQIHSEVDNYLRWHRKNALPEYIAFLQHVNVAIDQQGGPTIDDVTRLRAEYRRLYQLTLEPVIQPAAHILSALDTQQITELANTFAEQDHKKRKKMLHGSEQEMLDARAERHVKLVEELVVSVSSEQEEEITEISLHIPFASGAYIDQRETQHALLIALLRGKAGEDQIVAMFRQWLTVPEASRTAQQQQAVAAYENAMNEMTVRIAGLLTARQKHHLTEEITAYIDDFRKLNSVAETEGANPQDRAGQAADFATLLNSR